MGSSDRFGQSGKSSSDGGHRRAWGSPILEAGQTVLAGMRSTTGWGDPDQGEVFVDAAVRFDSAGRTLTAAHPGDDWAGAGAYAYAAANHRQTGRADAIGALDRRVHQVVSRQAHQVTVRRESIDEQSDFLADLSHVTRALGTIPGVGRAVQATVEVAAVTAAVQQSEQDLRLLSHEVSTNAVELNDLAASYDALAVPESPPVFDEDPVPGGDRPDEQDSGAADDEKSPETGPAPTAPVVAGPIPTVVPEPSAPLPPVPAPTDPYSPGSAHPPAAAGAASDDPAAGLTSGLTSAFGAVGGMIGAVVAPLSAVLTGAVGTAVQSVSGLSGGDMADGDDKADTDKATLPDGINDESGSKSEELAAGADATGDDGTGPAEPAPVEDGTAPAADGPRAPVPAGTGAPDLPAATPPAPTRPPQ
ncbi:EspA/EspE family type VII secretion system effector [Mycolicibacterium vaccae]|uniref:EspA/EspE family type VII secretion system effector n=1 Tax=Mycolicibacterium vaccae TaxID=1810 RepID=UPI003CF1F42E